jgi:hypothetical protein
MEGRARDTQTRNGLFSVGHSNHALADFLALLARASIAAIADVRSQPYSRWLPQFNRGDLERALRAQGTGYVFLGHLLGGRPEDPGLYDADGRVDYERVRQTDDFRDGIARLGRETNDRAVAVLCSEEDPLDCHRGLMIAPACKAVGVEMQHVRADGRVETMSAMEARLLGETGVGAGVLDGLFAAQLTEEDRQALLADAYRLQAKRRAFRQRETEAE